MTTIHANPAHRWTIAGLAQRSNLSRSAFADRFTRRVGEAPATYIAQLRLANAASLLLETREPVNVVATMVATSRKQPSAAPSASATACRLPDGGASTPAVPSRVRRCPQKLRSHQDK